MLADSHTRYALVSLEVQGSLLRVEWFDETVKLLTPTELMDLYNDVLCDCLYAENRCSTLSDRLYDISITLEELIDLCHK